MAGSVNKVILVGNLGRDPEVRAMQSGDEVVNLSIATSENWKDKMTGERKERTQWHKIVIFNKGLVSVAKQYLRKGSKVYIEGQLETRKWTDQSGVEKYTTEIVLRPYSGELTMLDSRSGGNAGDGYDNSYGSAPMGGGNAGPMAASNAQSAPDFDDDIPF